MLKVFNKTRGKILSKKAGLADTYISRLRGLMLSPRRDLVFKFNKPGVKAASIHMMFMTYPIDLVWTDEEMKVVDVKWGVKPFNPFKPSTWRIYAPKKPAAYLIELGLNRNPEVGEGDYLELEVDSPSGNIKQAVGEYQPR